MLLFEFGCLEYYHLPEAFKKCKHISDKKKKMAANKFDLNKYSIVMEVEEENKYQLFLYKGEDKEDDLYYTFTIGPDHTLTFNKIIKSINEDLRITSIDIPEFPKDVAPEIKVANTAAPATAAGAAVARAAAGAAVAGAAVARVTAAAAKFTGIVSEPVPPGPATFSPKKDNRPITLICDKTSFIVTNGKEEYSPKFEITLRGMKDYYLKTGQINTPQETHQESRVMKSNITYKYTALWPQVAMPGSGTPHTSIHRGNFKPASDINKYDATGVYSLYNNPTDNIFILLTGIGEEAVPISKLYTVVLDGKSPEMGPSFVGDTVGSIYAMEQPGDNISSVTPKKLNFTYWKRPDSEPNTSLYDLVVCNQSPPLPHHESLNDCSINPKAITLDTFGYYGQLPFVNINYPKLLPVEEGATLDKVYHDIIQHNIPPNIKFNFANVGKQGFGGVDNIKTDPLMKIPFRIKYGKDLATLQFMNFYNKKIGTMSVRQFTKNYLLRREPVKPELKKTVKEDIYRTWKGGDASNYRRIVPYNSEEIELNSYATPNDYKKKTIDYTTNLYHYFTSS